MAEQSEIKVLLVEDNPGDALLFRDMLKRARTLTQRYHIQAETTLNGAIVRLADERFDVILLDLGLPDSQGITTLKILSSHSGQVPIVVLTGLADEGCGLRAVQDGAQDYLIKGKVTGELLTHCIKYAIERKRLERELKDKLDEIERINRVMVVGRELDMQDLRKEIRRLRSRIEELESRGKSRPA